MVAGHTRDEIVVDTNLGGRSTFRNAGSTTRRGAELSYSGQWSPTLRSTVSFTALNARFDSGNRLPGTLDRIKRIAHGLSGAGGIYGFAEISDAAATLEDAAIAELADAGPGSGNNGNPARRGHEHYSSR